MFSRHTSQTSQESATNTNAEPASQGHRPMFGQATMNLRNHARTLVLASILVAAVSTSALTVHFAGAEPVDQTGPNGAQCHLKSMGGDIVDPSNSDTTNNSDITLSPVTGSPDGTGPQMTVAGCNLTIQPPPPPPPTPTPVPPPPRHITLQNSAGIKHAF